MLIRYSSSTRRQVVYAARYGDCMATARQTRKMKLQYVIQSLAEAKRLCDDKRAAMLNKSLLIARCRLL